LKQDVVVAAEAVAEEVAEVVEEDFMVGAAAAEVTELP
jgi:hypothetical protein